MASKREIRKRRRNKYGFSAWPKRRKILVTVALVILAVGSLGMGLVLSKISRLNRTKAFTEKEVQISENIPHKDEGYLNVALFGVDSREASLGAGTRSDTIMVASLNLKTNDVKVASIYRDTFLSMEDGSFNKANAAYSFGGPREAISMLNRNLDLDITHFVTVNFESLTDTVDCLGGVRINVKPEEFEELNYRVKEQAELRGVKATELKEPGKQRLNGIQATAYCRIRKIGNDDFERTERQRRVLKELSERLKDAPASKLNTLINTVFPEIATNFTVQELLYYAKRAGKCNLTGAEGFPDTYAFANIPGVGSSIIPTQWSQTVDDIHVYFFGEDEGYVPSGTVKGISNEIMARAGGMIEQ